MREGQRYFAFCPQTERLRPSEGQTEAINPCSSLGMHCAQDVKRQIKRLHKKVIFLS